MFRRSRSGKHAAAIANNPTRARPLRRHSRRSHLQVGGGTGQELPSISKAGYLDDIPGSVAGAYNSATLSATTLTRTLRTGRTHSLQRTCTFTQCLRPRQTRTRSLTETAARSALTQPSQYTRLAETSTRHFNSDPERRKGAKTYKEEQAVWVDGRTIYQSTARNRARLSS